MTKALMLLLLVAIAPVSIARAGEADIQENLQKRIPQIGQIKQINKSPLPGLYEVVTQDHLFYTDENALFLIDGAMYDLKSMRNITDERYADRADFASGQYRYFPGEPVNATIGVRVRH